MAWTLASLRNRARRRWQLAVTLYSPRRTSQEDRGESVTEVGQGPPYSPRRASIHIGWALAHHDLDACIGDELRAAIRLAACLDAPHLRVDQINGANSSARSSSPNATRVLVPPSSTACASWALASCRFWIFSSTVPAQIKRYTNTGLS
jgi:hypothetical protein